MARVEWPSVDADIGLIPVALLALFPTVMALDAEGLNGARAECGDVAMVRQDVIDRDSWDDETPRRAQPAERLVRELSQASLHPPVAAV
jgi:hypothetical protein